MVELLPKAQVVEVQNSDAPKQLEESVVVA